MTVQMHEFEADTKKYFNFAKSNPVVIDSGEGYRFTISIMIEPEEFCEPTSAELEIIRRGEENRKKGHYYKKLPGETTEAFFNRITSDPEKQMVCNSAQWQNREYQ